MQGQKPQEAKCRCIFRKLRSKSHKPMRRKIEYIQYHKRCVNPANVRQEWVPRQPSMNRDVQFAPLDHLLGFCYLLEFNVRLRAIILVHLNKGLTPS
jgi:hypothetical protein